MSTITRYKSVQIADLETERRVEIQNVGVAKVSGGLLKTATPEPILWFNPTIAGAMKQATVIGVSTYIKTGTSGAGYVSANANVGNLTEIAPDKQTLAWT